MERIKLCGYVFDLDNKYNYTKAYVKDYLTSAEKADFYFSVSEEEIENGLKSSASCSKGYVESLCFYRKICFSLADKNCFMMHSSAVFKDGFAFIFAAKSGTGKTTHSRLWLEEFPGSFIINGDKPLFSLEGGIFYVHGTPWSGKERYNQNIKAPVKALCFLEQAKENSIRQLSKKEIVKKIFNQVYFPEDKNTTEKILSLLDLFLEKIPCYLLGCTISSEAVIMAEKTLNI